MAFALSYGNDWLAFETGVDTIQARASSRIGQRERSFSSHEGAGQLDAYLANQRKPLNTFAQAHPRSCIGVEIELQLTQVGCGRSIFLELFVVTVVPKLPSHLFVKAGEFVDNLFMARLLPARLAKL